MNNHDTSSEDAFGFSSISTAKEKIRNIRPTQPEGSVDVSRIDAVADTAGFVSREAIPPPTEYVYRSGRQAKPEPRIPLNMRVPVSLGNSFQRFCEQNRYSYPEALAEVLKRAGVLTN